jgi:hypothetical protein
MKSLCQATAETVAASHQAVQNSLSHLSHRLPITTQVRYLWRVRSAPVAFSLQGHCRYLSLQEHCRYHSLQEHCSYLSLQEHCSYLSLQEHCSYLSLQEHCSYLSLQEHCRYRYILANSVAEPKIFLSAPAPWSCKSEAGFRLLIVL